MSAPVTPPGQFKVLCCRARRRLHPEGVLICMACDGGLDMPRSAEFIDVPDGETRWPPRG